MLGQEIRLNKIISGKKNCVIAALDAGGFFGPYPGLIELPDMCKILKDADAILIEHGAINICKNVFLGENPPLLITRLNWNSDYCFQWKYNKSKIAKAVSPALALSMGADLGIASLSINTGDESTDSRNVGLFIEIIEEARKAGLPVIGEIYPAMKNFQRFL